MELKFGLLAVKKPIEEMFQVAYQSGVSHVEIDLIKEHSYVESFSAKRISKINKLAKKYKITVSLHIPYTINPSDNIPSIRKANVEYLKKCIILAHKLNATHITTHIGYCNGLPSWDWMRKQALDRLALSLHEVIPSCKKYKVCLALENVNPMPKDSEFFYLGDNIHDLEYIYTSIKSPLLKLCLDIGHANTSEGPMPYLRKFGEKLVSIHFHDNNGNYDEHLAVGQGTVDWKSVANELNKMKFHGPLVSEVFSRTPQEAREDLENYF